MDVGDLQVTEPWGYISVFSLCGMDHSTLVDFIVFLHFKSRDISLVILGRKPSLVFHI